jgi:hypothetical protein
MYTPTISPHVIKMAPTYRRACGEALLHTTRLALEARTAFYRVYLAVDKKHGHREEDHYTASKPEAKHYLIDTCIVTMDAIRRSLVFVTLGAIRGIRRNLTSPFNRVQEIQSQGYDTGTQRESNSNKVHPGFDVPGDVVVLPPVSNDQQVVQGQTGIISHRPNTSPLNKEAWAVHVLPLPTVQVTSSGTGQDGWSLRPFGNLLTSGHAADLET